MTAGITIGITAGMTIEHKSRENARPGVFREDAKMKRLLLGLWVSALLLSGAAVPSGGLSASAALGAVGTDAAASALQTTIAAAGEGFTGTKNTARWEPDSGVDYERYDFLGRGEELLKEVQAKYPDYKADYRLEGKSVGADELNRMINLMAVYGAADPAAKTLTVELDTVQVRLQCEYTALRGSAGSFITVGFTANLPTRFIASIGGEGSVKGEVCQEGITPAGEKGTYTAVVKLTVPYVEEGRYYLNFSIDSGNAGFPHLLSVPFDITEGRYSGSPYQLLYTGDWDLITAPGYRESLTELFYACYPRLYARFGLGGEPKTITFEADKGYDGVAYSVGRTIVVSVDYANAHPGDIGFFSHELTHSVQQYGDRLNYDEAAWWIENMANYGRFRYFHWMDAAYVQLYRADDPSLMDWGYAPYGSSQWFFSYMDAKYPTRREASGELRYGLIDSINRLIKQYTGGQLNDDPRDPATPINQTVKEITGCDCIDDLRAHYAEELQSGRWTFTGFGNYPDNFITENLPGLPDPDYPMLTSRQPGSQTARLLDELVTGEGNLCLGGTVSKASGQTGAAEGAELLIDGNENTKWCSTAGTVTDTTYCLDGTPQWVVIDLGGQKSFDTYTIFNTGTKENYGNMTEWELLTSDDGRSWRSVDYQPACREDKASFYVGRQSGRYLLLRAYNPDDSQAGTVRLYELQLFRQKQQEPAAPGDLDGDGEVSIQDVMEACKVLARKAAGQAPSAEELRRGELNGDGEITISDVMEICKLLARKA